MLTGMIHKEGNGDHKREGGEMLSGVLKQVREEGV